MFFIDKYLHPCYYIGKKGVIINARNKQILWYRHKNVLQT